MSLIGVATICHPPCIKYLDRHLRSIQDAMMFSDQGNVRISLVCSSVSEEEDKERIREIVNGLAGRKCRTLQGYNQVIKRSSLQDRGFNEALGAAEDREMSLYLRGVRGEKIKFAPSCQIRHSFDFTRDQIIARHTIHGMWNRTVFGMYHPGREAVLPKKHEADKIFTTDLFQTAAGLDYVKLSNAAYMTGRAYSGNPRYADHRLLIKQGGINALVKAERTL